MGSVSKKTIRIVALGDIVGRPGRRVLKEKLTGIRAERQVDLIVANAENASGGVGLDPESARELKSSGVDIITLGDHTWQNRELQPFLNESAAWCLRPANYPNGAPGCGYTTFKLPQGDSIGIMNLIGRVFMNNYSLECPFRKAEMILRSAFKDCKVVLCDLHAEASSEKYAMGRYLDGRISLLVGTHTHVQTADDQILPGGTGYITDLGMCGSGEGVIGMDSEVAIDRFLTGLPHAYKLAKGKPALNGVLCEIDTETGKALQIERLRVCSEEVSGN